MLGSLFFSVNSKRAIFFLEQADRFPENERTNRIKEVNGDIFHCRTKVPFIEQPENHRREENVGFSLHPLYAFYDP